MNESLGDRIRKARGWCGLSQAALARRIGVSTTTMNKIEGGDTPDPRASRISAMADALDVSADYLLGRTEAAAPPHRKRPRPRTAAPVR